MRGLLKKDAIILLTTYRKNLISNGLLYIALSFALKLPIFVKLLGMIAGFSVSSIILLDSNSQWDLYAAGLPVSRRQVISAKYVLTLLMLLGCQLITLLCLALMGLTGRAAPDFGLLEALVSSVSVFASSLLFFGANLHLTYRFGSDKARTAMMAIGMVVFAGIFLLSASASGPALPSAFLFQALFMHPAALLVGGLALCLGGFALCWHLTVRFYEAKEF